MIYYYYILINITFFCIYDNKLIKIADQVLYFENFESNFKKFKNKYSPLITNQDIKLIFLGY